MRSLAIVGATGVVGRCVLKVLEEEKLGIDEYILFASNKSQGKIVKFMEKDYNVNVLNEDSFNSHIDYAIFSAGGDIAKKFAPIAARNGTVVVDNSSAFRMAKNVPLIVPEVNIDEIKNHNGIIANPNCSTIQAVVPLKALDDVYKLKRIVYSTYQAVSGAGKMGIEDLENGIANYYKNSHGEKSEYKLKKFDYPIFNNCLPQIDVFTDNGYTKEELKMINETRKILNRPELKITATCVRVPIFNSHGESINVEFERDFNMQELVEILKNAKGVKLFDDISNLKYPKPTDATFSNDVYVGRVRRDYSAMYGINMWVVADNLRKGAATNAVQIVKELIEREKINKDE